MNEDKKAKSVPQGAQLSGLNVGTISDQEPPGSALATSPNVDTLSLADRLKTTGRHPVLVFGTATSGKSTLLMSMMRSLKLNPEINIILGEPILSDDHPERISYHRLATQFFDYYEDDFDKGNVLESTQLDKPLFIPVDIQPRFDDRPVKFAFLEGKGDWHTPNRTGSGNLYPDLKPEILDVIANFPEGISCIYVAPYSVEAGGSIDTQDSDSGLMGIMNAYQRHRSAPSRDYHLFLLTKWDLFASALRENPRFSEVDPADVLRICEERYHRAWPCYQALLLDGMTDRRFFMQYVAGYISGGKVRAPADRHRDAYERYPKTIWNWLYGNATYIADEQNNQRISLRKILFEDVMRTKPVRVTFFKKASSFLVSRGSRS